DFFGVQVGGRGPHGAVDGVLGVGESRQFHPAGGHECGGEGVAGQASGAAHALQVGGHAAGHGGEHDRRQVADVDAHFQGGGGHEHVGCVGGRVRGLELVFVIEPLAGGQQAGVFTGDDAARV